MQICDISLKVCRSLTGEAGHPLARRKECVAVSGSNSLEWRSDLWFLSKEGNGRS